MPMNVKIIFSVVFFTTVGLVVSNEVQNVGCFNVQHFEQKLDHFKDSDVRIWRQKFQLSNASYEKGGPVFMFMTGETNSVDLEEYENTQWMQWAKILGAFVVVANQRYYQKDLLIKEKNIQYLQFLTSEQTLVDFANLIVYIQKLCKLPVNTNWVTIGGSYGGTIAAWMRLRYPHLIHSAIAVSAPMEMTLEEKNYEEVILKTLEKAEDGCRSLFVDAAKQVVNLLQSNASEIEDLFLICRGNLRKRRNAEIFKYLMYYEVAAGIQYNRMEAAKEVCKYLKNFDSTPIENFARYITRMTRQKLKEQNMNCVPMIFEDRVNKNSIYDNLYAWEYEKCTSYGLFKTSSIFQLNIEFFMEKCKYLFGDITSISMLENNIKELNLRNGGKNCMATNVLYVCGSNDPWIANCITEPKTSNSKAILIEGGHHDTLLDAEKKEDSEKLKHAREETLKYLKSKLLN